MILSESDIKSLESNNNNINNKNKSEEEEDKENEKEKEPLNHFPDAEKIQIHSINNENKNKSLNDSENLIINNWTLRKCSAKVLDRFSNFWPKWTIENTKTFLENELQNEDWKSKEKALLVLGALSNGCYEILKPHLSCILPYVIKELQHPNKFIRAITCWTLSRL